MFEGVRRGDMPGQDGSVRASAYYSIVRAEWPDVRRKLEAPSRAEPGGRIERVGSSECARPTL